MTNGPDAEEIALGARRIAVVGASPDSSRPSNGVMRYLLEAGYDVIPVRPGCAEILGRPCVSSLEEIPEPIDIVDVFRREEAAAAIAEEAVRTGAGAVWLQSGIRSLEARRICEEAGIAFVEDRCLRTVLQAAGR